MKSKKILFTLGLASFLCACGGNSETPVVDSSSSEETTSSSSSLESLPSYYAISFSTGEHYSIAAVDGYDPTSVLEGTSFKFTVTVDFGYAVEEVKANDTILLPTENVYTIPRVDSNVSVTARVVNNTVSVTLPTGVGYTASAEEGYDPENIVKGDNFCFTIDVADHYHLNSVSVGGEELVPEEGVYTIVNIQADTTVVIDVAEDTYSVSMPTGAYYDITLLSENINLEAVKYSEVLTFTVDAKDHCTVEAVKMNGTAMAPVAGVYTITNQTEDVVISVEASIETHTVTIPTSEDYTINACEGYDASRIEYGGDFCFTVTPAADHSLKSVKVGGETLTAESGVYTISNITTDVTISVETDLISRILNDVVGATDKALLHQTSEFVSPAGWGYGDMYLYDTTYGGQEGYSVNGFFKNVSLAEINQLDFYIFAAASNDVLDVFKDQAGIGYGMWGGHGACIRAEKTATGWKVSRRNGNFVTHDGTSWGEAASYEVEGAKFLGEIFRVSTTGKRLAISEIVASGKIHSHTYEGSACTKCGEVNLLANGLSSHAVIEEDCPSGVSAPINPAYGELYHMTSTDGCFTYNVFNDLDISGYNEISFVTTAGRHPSHPLWLVQGEDNQMADAHCGLRAYNNTYNVFYVYEIKITKTSTGWTISETNNRNEEFFMSTNGWANEGTSYEVNGGTKLNEVLHFGSWNTGWYLSAMMAK